MQPWGRGLWEEDEVGEDWTDGNTGGDTGGTLVESPGNVVEEECEPWQDHYREDFEVEHQVGEVEEGGYAETEYDYDHCDYEKW